MINLIIIIMISFIVGKRCEVMKCDGFLQILLRNKLKHDDTRILAMMLMSVVEIIYIIIMIMIMMNIDEKMIMVDYESG